MARDGPGRIARTIRLGCALLRRMSEAASPNAAKGPGIEVWFGPEVGAGFAGGG